MGGNSRKKNEEEIGRTNDGEATCRLLNEGPDWKLYNTHGIWAGSEYAQAFYMKEEDSL